MNYIEHHGIKGQKWGVRRYQNEDGSYKQGAKGRYDDSGSDSPRKKKNFGTSKMVKSYAGKSSVGGIIGKTIAGSAALSVGAAAVSTILHSRGHETAAKVVSKSASAGIAYLNAIGITAAIQRGRGKI